jgi:hypothetical protein
MDATIDVPGIGTVRITAKRFRHKHGKAVMYFWTGGDGGRCRVTPHAATPISPLPHALDYRRPAAEHARPHNK